MVYCYGMMMEMRDMAVMPMPKPLRALASNSI